MKPFRRRPPHQRQEAFTLPQARYHVTNLVNGMVKETLAALAGDAPYTGAVPEEEAVVYLVDANRKQPADLLAVALAEAVMMLARERMTDHAPVD